MLPYLEEFILSLENNNYSEETTSNYRRDLEIFTAFLTSKPIEFLQVDKMVISEYKGFLRNQNYRPYLDKLKHPERKIVEPETFTEIKKLRGPGRPVTKYKYSLKDSMYSGQLSAKSVNRMLSSLRSYLSFLVDNDKPLPLPPSAIKMIKMERKEPQVADLNDLVRLIESPTQFEDKEIVAMRNRAILELILSTGMRISEVVNMDREQVRMEQGKVVDDRIYIQGKGKKQRFVYLTQRGREYLEKYFALRTDSYPAAFIPTKGMRASTQNPYIVRISQNYIQMKIAEYRRRIGINVPTSAHSLRHGFATYLAEEGASPAAIQKLLGHESLNTTTRYVHASDRFAEQAHRKFHPVQDQEVGAQKTVDSEPVDLDGGLS
jgi:site-specific recombinase XerD